MTGSWDDCLPLSYYYEKLNLDRFEIKENRNTIASIVAGSLFSEGEDEGATVIKLKKYQK
jgi:hypothetical protein